MEAHALGEDMEAGLGASMGTGGAPGKPFLGTNLGAGVLSAGAGAHILSAGLGASLGGDLGADLGVCEATSMHGGLRAGLWLWEAAKVH